MSQSFQFDAGVFDTELPIDAALFRVGLGRPGGDLGLQFRQFTDAAAAQALARQAAQLAFGGIQPTAVLRRVTEFEPSQVRPCSNKQRGTERNGIKLSREWMAHI